MELGNFFSVSVFFLSAHQQGQLQLTSEEESVGIGGLVLFNNTSPWERPDMNVDVKQSN